MKKISIKLVGLVMLILMFQNTVFSSEGVGFSINGILPENQINKDVTYFDLHMEPKQIQNLQVIIYNSSNEEITVEIKANTAGTNNGGLIEYGKPDITDPSLDIRFEDISYVDEEIVTILPKEKHIANIKVSMPEEEFDGIVLGGIMVRKLEENTEIPDSITVQNEYAYVLGVKLQETNIKVIPNINLLDIYPTLDNGYEALALNIQNDEKAVIKDMSLKADFYKIDSSEQILTMQKEHIDMAPNSNFDWMIETSSVGLLHGKYKLELEIILDDKPFIIEETFEITKDEVKEIKSQAIPDKDSNYWKVLAIGAFTIIILLLVFIIGLALQERKKK